MLCVVVVNHTHMARVVFGFPLAQSDFHYTFSPTCLHFIFGMAGDWHSVQVPVVLKGLSPGERGGGLGPLLEQMELVGLDVESGLLDAVRHPAAITSTRLAHGL